MNLNSKLANGRFVDRRIHQAVFLDHLTSGPTTKARAPYRKYYEGEAIGPTVRRSGGLAFRHSGCPAIKSSGNRAFGVSGLLSSSQPVTRRPLSNLGYLASHFSDIRYQDTLAMPTPKMLPAMTSIRKC